MKASDGDQRTGNLHLHSSLTMLSAWRFLHQKVTRKSCFSLDGDADTDFKMVDRGFLALGAQWH